MNRYVPLAGLVVLLALAGTARAAAPSFIPIQGFLTDDDGKAVDGAVMITFALYNAPVAGQQLWSEQQEIAVDDGLFVAYLGFAEPLPLTFFVDNSNLWLAIKVETDDEMQRVFMGSVPFAAYAEYCGNSPDHFHDTSQLSGVAKAGQMCPAGEVVDGFDANGNIMCVMTGVYTGQNFALSGQTCGANQVMVGIDTSGFPICSGGQGGSYDGKDFALSNQDCSGDKVVVGINYNGSIICEEAGGGIGGSGSSKYIPKFKNSDELEKSAIYESSGKIGINNTSPSQTLDVKGNLKVSGEIHWGGSKFTSSSCLVVGSSSCSSACSAHGMSCYKAFAIDKDSTSTSCSQSGFKFCCCKD